MITPERIAVTIATDLIEKRAVSGAVSNRLASSDITA
jgi:hypothetical protein